jgi:hypothetical protein
MSVMPRSPIPTILAGSPKQSPAQLEDIRQRLAAAWSTSPFPDIDTFVLNARAHDPNLRRTAPAMVMRVARSMDLDFGASAVAKAAALRDAWSEPDVSAPEQARRADAMNTAALTEYNRLQALRRPR